MKEVKAVEVYDLIKLSGRWDEPSKKSCVGTYTRKYLAEKEKRECESNIPESESWDNVVFMIHPRLISPSGYRPKNFVHLEEVKPVEDACGEIRELYNSDNLSLAYIHLSGKAKEHRHSVMEEIYFVAKGEGSLNIGEENYKIEEGDTINIPKDTWHFLESKEGKLLEVLVVTHPKFSLEDVILREG